MTHKEMLDAAEVGVAAAARAEELRRELRHSVAPNDPERLHRIDEMLESLRVAMIPLRSATGRLGWEPGPAAVTKAVRDASRFVQYQRKQLKKMRR